jgi:hypothetical protein
MSDRRTGVSNAALAFARWVALAKIVLSCLAFAAIARRLDILTVANFYLHIVMFAGVGLWLHFAAGEDRRAVVLGTYFLLVATAWTDRPLHILAASSTLEVARIPGFLAHSQVVAFSPLVFWLFVRDFPRRGHRGAPLYLRGAIAASLAGGALLVGASLLTYVALGRGGPTTSGR